MSSIVGGNAAARQLPWSDALHALHLPTLQWFTLAAPGPMPSPRYGHAAAIVDGAATVASRTLVRGGGLTKAVAGSPAEVQLTACDARGQPKWAGGDSFEVTLVGESGGDAAGTTLNARVTDNLDGTYAAQYFPSRSGAYKLVVSLVHHAGALEGFGAGCYADSAATFGCGEASLSTSGSSDAGVAAGAHGATMATMGTTREQVGGSHCVKVSPGAAYALRATLPSAWATAGEEFGPIELSLVDSLGNVLAQRLSTPPLVEMRVAAPLRAASGDTSRLPSSAKCVCEIAKFEASSAGHGACRGGARMWLKLKGDAARVTLVLSAPCAGQHLDNESTPAKAIGNESAEEAAGQLLPAELLIHLTGAAHQLCASVASRGAVCDQIYGPIKVVAADEYGNAVGCAPDSPHFEPAVTVRRRKLASDSGPSSPMRGGKGGAATHEDQREQITCEIARTLWQRSGSAGCPMALVWLMLRGSSGEIVLQVTDGLGRVPCSASVPIYLTGPPFSLRASHDVEGTCVCGEESGPLIVRLVDARGKQVCGLPLNPVVSLLPDPPTPRNPKRGVSIHGAIGAGEEGGVDGTPERAGSRDSLGSDPSAHMAELPCSMSTTRTDLHTCTVSRLEWQRSAGTSVAAAVAIYVKLRGRAGDVPLWVHDAAGYACASLPLQLKLRAGPTVAARCVISPGSSLSTPLACGQWNSMVLQCKDEHGNAAKAAADLIELAIRSRSADQPAWQVTASSSGAGASATSVGSSLPDAPAAAKVEALADGAYKLYWRVISSGTHSLDVLVNGVSCLAAPRTLELVAAAPRALKVMPTGRQVTTVECHNGPHAATSSSITFEAGKKITLRVQLYDEFGNLVSAPVEGPPPLGATTPTSLPSESTLPPFILGVDMCANEDSLGGTDAAGLDLSLIHI